MRRARLALLALAAAGCAGGLPAPPLDGGAAAYRAGEPGFVLEAVATVRADTSGIDVYLGLPPASLVHRQQDGALVAVARWTVTVEREGAPPVLRTPTDTLRAATADEALSGRPVWRRERAVVAPGRYRVRAVVEDRGSERTAERTAIVDVPAPDARPSLGTLRVEGMGASGQVEPVDPGAVPAGLDSLRAVVQALHAPDGAAATLTVERVRADTAAAGPLVAFTPTPTSLAALGVDLGSAETVQRVRQPVEAPAEALDVEAPLPPLRPGVYRIRVELGDPAGERLATAERLLVVRRRDYPRVTRLGDLLGPLAYLADDREVARIRALPTAAAQRAAFDRFWGERMDDRRLAAATVRAYFERVEEANRLFGAAKEGWQTDPGMVYVLFGPPRYVEVTPAGERWTYGAGGSAPPAVVFERTAGGLGAPFAVLTARRDPVYADAWRRARRLWRSGVVP